MIRLLRSDVTKKLVDIRMDVILDASEVRASNTFNINTIMNTSIRSTKFTLIGWK
jgi:hypothetical protein